MFSGIVEGMATVVRAARKGGGVRLTLNAQDLAREAQLGDSIAVDGVCLTVVSRRARLIEFDVVPETLSRTTLGRLSPRHRVNLECSLRLSDRIGGHLVTGHVDGVGTIVGFDRQPGQVWLTVKTPPELTSGLLMKGSIAIAGISLTLAAVDDDRFSVALVPHTLRATTLGASEVGGHVNLETDLLGKWVRRLLEDSDALPSPRALRKSRKARR